MATVSGVADGPFGMGPGIEILGGGGSRFSAPGRGKGQTTTLDRVVSFLRKNKSADEKTPAQIVASNDQDVASNGTMEIPQEPEVISRPGPEIFSICSEGEKVEFHNESANGNYTPTVSARTYYDLAEVSKHTTEEDCWIVVNGKVLDVTNYLPEHPGGSLAILSFAAGRDCSEEFNMIHPEGVIEKYAPDSVIGDFATSPLPPAAANRSLNQPLLDKSDDNNIANEHNWGAWREQAAAENPGIFIINFGNGLSAAGNAASSFLLELACTIFSTSNLKFTNDRSGLTRSALMLLLFMVIHVIGNLNVFSGPDEFNGYGYVYKRLYWTCGGLVDANIVEVYLALAGVMHVTVAMKRTWDINRNMPFNSGKLNLIITGSLLLCFLCVHLSQFRFGDAQPYKLRPPPYYLNFGGLSKSWFYTDDESVQPVAVRDIYKLEFDVFQNPVWAFFYMFSTTMFMLHACWGWAKVVPSALMQIPKGHQTRVIYMGYVIVWLVALCYMSFPLYCFFYPMQEGALGKV